MPIVEHEPWRQQYFEGVPCPDDVFVPTDDGDAYLWFPDHRWVYNKLLIAETQGIPHAPHGIPPDGFPVFSKPIYNMRGMGTGSGVIRSAEQWQVRQRPGHMWMALMTGEHVSTDVAVVDGEPRWWRHATGKPLKGGMFDYWIVHAEPWPEIERYCGDWIARSLGGYTGIVNLETIGGRIIECHLRLTDQWPDLYGPGWVEALVRLYAEGRWSYDDTARRDGYSVVLFGGHGLEYSIDRSRLDEFLDAPGVSSIQITFYDDRPPEAHAMPPGGFRLAIVNCWDLEAGLELRDRLALRFWSTQHTRRPRRRSKAGPA